MAFKNDVASPKNFLYYKQTDKTSKTLLFRFSCLPFSLIHPLSLFPTLDRIKQED